MKPFHTAWSLSCCLTLAPLAFGQSVAAPDGACVEEAPPVPKRHRLFIGSEFGLLYGTSLVVDGEKAEPEDGMFAFAFRAGSGIRLSDDWSVLALARASSWDTDWANHRGEVRWRYDFAVGPEIQVEQSPRRPHQTWHLALPIGGTLAKATPGPSRGLEQSYGLGYGLNAGLIVSYVLSGLHHGAHFDVSLTSRVTWIGQESWFKDEPDVRDEQQLRYVDHTLAFSIGYVFRL